MDIERREKLRRTILYSIEALIVVGLLFCAYVFNWVDGRLTYIVEGTEYRTDVVILSNHLKLPDDPDVPGYDFYGWYTDDETFENKFDLSDLPDVLLFKKTVVYAKLVEHHHVYDRNVIVVEPTCTKEGLMADVCNLNGCGDQINTKSVEKISHKFEAKILTAPTCTSLGSQVEICAYYCGTETNYTSIPKIEHSYRDTVLKQPTCTSEGERADVCSYGCGTKINFAPIEKLEHNYKFTVLSEATCVADGEEADVCIYNCGTIVNRTPIEKIPHSYKYNLISDATCMEYGKAEDVCEYDCGEVIEITLEKIPHNFEHKILIESTCMLEGEEADVCSYNCGTKINSQIIAKIPHIFEHRIIEEVSCLKNGSEGDVCTYECGTQINVVKIPKFDHTLENGALEKNVINGNVAFNFTANCTTCLTKIEEKNVSVSKKVHSVHSCLADGKYEYIYVFEKNSYVYVDILPIKPHTLNGVPASTFYSNDNGNILYGTNKVALDENVYLACGSTAPGHYICESCNRYIAVTVERVHEEVRVLDYESTCTELGYYKYVCTSSDCDVIFGYDEIPVLGHALKKSILRQSDNSYLLYSQCNRLDCDYETYDTVTNVRSVITKSANCCEEGVKTYYYTINGVESSFAEPIPMSDHVSQGKCVTDYYIDGRVSVNFPGLIYFGNSGAPDCERSSDGFYFCDICDPNKTNPIYVVVYKPHNYVDIGSSAGTTCSESGTKTQICTYCNTTRVVSNSIAHKFTWTLVVEDRDGNYGREDIVRATAVCSVCSKEAVVEIDANGQDKSYTSYTYKAGSNCKQTAEHVFTFNKTVSGYGKVNVSKSISTNTYGEHRLNGKNLSSLLGTDGVPDGSDIKTLKYSIDGVHLFGNIEIELVCYNVSGALASGWFMCECCNRVISQAVYIDHVIEESGWMTVRAATCDIMGEERAVCDCGEVFTRSIKKLDHNYQYAMTPNFEADSNRILSFTISRDCTGCTTADSAKWKTVTYTPWNASSDEITVEVITPSSCCQIGTTKYIYNKSGVYASCEVTDYGTHSVCGKGIYELQYQVTDKDGNRVWVISSETEGISLPVEYYPINDGDIVNGGFICDECGEFIISSVIVVVEDDE